jgi:NitT/TauT family transport system substrate-binding protein
VQNEIVLASFSRLSRHAHLRDRAKIKCPLQQRNLLGTALYVAKDSGICKQEGLDLELVMGAGSAPTVSAVVGGYVQFVQVSASSRINAAANGAPVVIVAKVMGPPPYKLVGAKGMKRIQDLKGKKIAVNRFGGAPDSLLKYVLTQNGLDAQKDVTILQMGDPSSRLISLFNGAIDATLLLVPQEKLAVEKGLPMIVDFATLKLPFVNIVLGANKKFLDDHPATARSFLACYSEAVARGKTDIEFTKKTLARWTRTNDASLLDYTYNSWRADYAPESLKIDSSELELLLAGAPKATAKKDLSRFLDMQYLP